MSGQPPFHLAFPVRDIEDARSFYSGLLGCRIGRESKRWIDFDFFGHQITAHLADDPAENLARTPVNQVDGKRVPVRHFGVVLDWDDWTSLKSMLENSGTDFLIEPSIRFENEVGEQATLFILDPSGNALEFKSFRNPDRLFARE